MIHLVYASSATTLMNEKELLSLLDQSRIRNERQNVTGMLLYSGGNFFQVLEGEASDVDEIYEAIINDERNKDNFILERKPIEVRAFPGWSMGFRELTAQDKRSIKGYSEFLDKEMKPSDFADNNIAIVELLYQFKTGNT